MDINVSKTCEELKESKTLQGICCCDRHEGKRDCIACPYWEDKECMKNLMFDCADLITAQIRKERAEQASKTKKKLK